MNPICPRCQRPSTYDCTFGRCATPLEGEPTIREMRPVQVEEPIRTTRKKPSKETP